MKNTLKLFFLFLCGSMLIPQLQAQTIDFETASYSEGTIIFDQYSGGDCGVKFYFEVPNSTSYPTIAEVGGTSAAVFDGPLGTECGVSSTMVDMPSPNQNVGCKFLTDALGNSTPGHPIIVVWDNTTLACSGDLLDIDGTGTCKIEAYDANGNMIANLSLNSSSTNAGNGNATPWSFSNVGVIKSIAFYPDNGYKVALDNFSPCASAPASCCGSGTNIVKNGDFVYGDQYFGSAYSSTANPIGPSSVVPQEYAVINSTQLGIINPNWNAMGNTNCTVGDRFMLVNGRTTLSGGKVVWRQTVTLDPGKDWVFCANLKNLPACAFDILPEIEILVGGTVINTATIQTDPNDPCDWQLVSTPYSTVGNSVPATVIFKIRLDETGYGDGNDVAIDEVSLKEDLPSPAPSTAFTHTVTPINSSTFNVTASHPGLSSDCIYIWSVCEVDNQANCIAGTELTSSTWQTNLTNQQFDGYNGTDVWQSNLPEGVFTYGKRYKITLTAQCACSEVGTTEQTVSAVYSPRLGNFSNPAAEAATIEQVQLYPNPSQGNITIELPGVGEEDIEIRIFNEKGQTVLNRSLSKGQSSWNLDLPELASGLYLVKMHMGQTTKTEKLIVTQ